MASPPHRPPFGLQLCVSQLGALFRHLLAPSIKSCSSHSASFIPSLYSFVQFAYPFSRDDKRFTEKKNKSERTRRKKEDNTRLRQLVDDVLANDPRIKRIKAEEKAARAAKKGGAAGANGAAKPLTAAEKKAAEEAKKKEEAEKKEAEKKALEATKGEREAAKKAKEAARKNLKKWKKVSEVGSFVFILLSLCLCGRSHCSQACFFFLLSCAFRLLPFVCCPFT